MEACRQALNTHQFPEPPTSCLIDLIELILTCNNFSFNGDHYLLLNWTCFKDLVFIAAHECIPKIRLRHRKRTYWLSIETIQLIRKKRLYKKTK